MKRTATVLTGAVITVLASSTVAQAATPARISGTFTTTQKVTQSQNGTPVGTVSKGPYSFRPTCATGACATTFTRVHGDGTKEIYTVRPSGAQYVGSTTYLGSCYANGGAGGVLVAKGYSYKETITLTPTKVVAGSVQAYKGTLRLVFTPTAVGQKKKCAAGSLTFALTSGRHTG